MRTARHRPQDLDPERRRLYDELTGGRRAQGPQAFPLVDDDGTLRGPFDGFLLAPVVGDALQRLGAAIRYGTGLDERVRERAILAVAAAEGSAFETASHEALGRSLGLGEDDLAAVRAGRVPDGLPADAALAHEVVLALLEGDVDDALWARADADLGAAGVVELVALVGYYRTLALQLRVLRVEDDEDAR